MADVVTAEVWKAVHGLILGGVVMVAFNMARDGAARTAFYPMLAKGLGVCVAIAVFAAVMVGQANCADGDPLFGYCEQAAGGFAASSELRLGRFLFFLILLGAPVIAGALSGRKRFRSGAARSTP